MHFYTHSAFPVANQYTCKLSRISLVSFTTLPVTEHYLASFTHRKPTVALRSKPWETRNKYWR
jgi:hypothetical protein